MRNGRKARGFQQQFLRQELIVYWQAETKRPDIPARGEKTMYNTEGIHDIVIMTFHQGIGFAIMANDLKISLPQ